MPKRERHEVGKLSIKSSMRLLRTGKTLLTSTLIAMNQERLETMRGRMKMIVIIMGRRREKISRRSLNNTIVSLPRCIRSNSNMHRKREERGSKRYNNSRRVNQSMKRGSLTLSRCVA